MYTGVSEVDWYQQAIDNLGLIEITKWYSIDNQNNISLNHFDFGHNPANKPVGKFPEQTKTWKGMRWTKRYAYADKDTKPLKLHIV